MKSQDIYSETYTIRAYEINPRGSLSIVSLCNIMQDAAGKHAHELGVAVDDMLAENYTWVLSRLAFKMDAWPGWRDDIEVGTWPSGIEKLFAFRDFRFTDQKNHPLGSAVSAWVVIDTGTRRPVRVGKFLEKLKLSPHGSNGTDNLLKKLPVLETYDHEERFLVRYSDLDVNRHVNNVSYIEWAVESIPAVVQRESILAELEINFLAETFFGEYALSRCLPQDETHTVFRHSIVSEHDGRELARARTVWKKAE